MIIWPAKDPSAVEKYAFDVTDALNGATISGSPALLGTGVTIASSSVVTADGRTLVEMLLSGGTAGSVAKVDGSLVTSGGETLTMQGVLAIGGESISLADAKAAQRIENDDEDVILAGFLRAAIGAVERATGKNLTAKIETQVVDFFPNVIGSARQAYLGRPYGDAPIRLFKGPVSEILSIDYDDGEGIEQSLVDFRLVEGGTSGAARLLPAFNACWPVTAFGAGAVRVTYVAGYDPTALPPELTQAAILLFGHFNANREAVMASERAAAVELPLGVAMLIEPYRSVGIA